MKTKEQFLAEQSEELAKFEREEAIRAKLPEAYREGATICIHSIKRKPHASVSLWDGFRTDKTLADALAIVEQYKDSILTCEHWKDGCVSTWPPALNDYANKESAIMVGSHAVLIEVCGGRRFGPDVKVEFWVDLPEVGLVELSLAVCGLWKLVPRVNANYNRYGECSSCTIDWPSARATADSFRTFWSEKPSYHGEYYFADYHNFAAWASHEIAAAKKAKA